MRQYNPKLYLKILALAVIKVIFWSVFFMCSGRQETKGGFGAGPSHSHRSTRSTWLAAHIQGTEVIRKRFRDKRETLLIGDRNISDITFYDPTDKSTILWNYFPPTFTCPHFVERVGTPRDGGKWMCGLEVFDKGGNQSASECIVYSFGVGKDSSLELEILQRTNCKVYAFDPTVTSFKFDSSLASKIQDEIAERTQFEAIALGPSHKKNNFKKMSLREIMIQYNHTWIDFLKMDIEGDEFDALLAIANDFDDLPFGHLNLEIHIRSEKAGQPKLPKRERKNNTATPNRNDWVSWGKKGEFEKFYKFWNMLEDKGLRAFAWEVNFNPCIFGRKPNVVEYSFVNIKSESKNKLLSFH